MKRVKIIMLLQFSWSQSMWWLYIQSVCWCYCRAGRYIKPMWNILTVNCVTDSCVWNLSNLARYWLQAAWGWHGSVETCSSVIICEIIVHLLVIVQNNKIQKCPHDQQIHIYFANYHTATCFDTIVVILRELVINTLPSYTSMSNAVAVHLYCIWHNCVTWQGIDYKLPDDDTIVSKHVGGVW